MANLTDKQQAFVWEYAQCLNATEAAAQAGYKGNRETLAVVGYENLRKHKVRAAIDNLLNERAMRAEEVLSRLSDQARGIPPNCFNVSGALIGVDFEKLREAGLLHLVKKLSYDRQGNPVIEFYDAQRALVELGKYHGLLTDRLKIDDWRSEAIEYIRRGEITYDALAEEFDDDLATELFRAAGVPVQTAAGQE